MRCSNVRRQLSPYLDRALAPARRQALEGHLDRCPACSAELERQRRLWARLDAAAGAPPLPPALWYRVQSALEVRPVPSHWTNISQWFENRLAFGATVAVGTALGLGLGAWLSLAVVEAPATRGAPRLELGGAERGLLAEAFAEDGLGWLAAADEPPPTGEDR